MTPGSLPLELYRGDSYHWQFRLWRDTGKTQPTDLTGVTAKAEIRDKPGGAKVVPMVCAVMVPNTVDVRLDATHSAQLPLIGAWDLQLTYPSGEVATVLAGSVMVTADVTDSTVAVSRTLVRVA